MDNMFIPFIPTLNIYLKHQKLNHWFNISSFVASLGIAYGVLFSSVILFKIGIMGVFITYGIKQLYSDHMDMKIQASYLNMFIDNILPQMYPLLNQFIQGHTTTHNTLTLSHLLLNAINSECIEAEIEGGVYGGVYGICCSSIENGDIAYKINNCPMFYKLNILQTYISGGRTICPYTRLPITSITKYHITLTNTNVDVTFNTNVDENTNVEDTDLDTINTNVDENTNVDDTDLIDNILRPYSKRLFDSKNIIAHKVELEVDLSSIDSIDSGTEINS